MMDMAVWQDYMKLLDNLGNTLDKLTGIERTKTSAVGRGDLPAVEECMKQEQVISLTLRGMDQKREKLLGRLGLTGVPLREMEARSPEECRMETRQAVEKLRRKYEVFQSASEVARNALECNIHAIEQLEKAQNVPPPENRPHMGADFTV